MKTPLTTQKIVMPILMMLVLICGLQGICYGQTSGLTLFMDAGERRSETHRFFTRIRISLGPIEEKLVYRVREQSIDNGLSGLEDVEVRWEGTKIKGIFGDGDEVIIEKVMFTYNKLRVAANVRKGTTLSATIRYDVGTTDNLPFHDNFTLEDTFTVKFTIVVGEKVFFPPPLPIYWTAGVRNKIQRLKTDSSNVGDLVTRGLERPLGIALDVAAGKMYWTGSNKIQRANLDGSNIEDLVIGLSVPYGIALDVAAGKMYWTHTRKIQRANLDGSNIEDLPIGLLEPRGIALDVVGGKMYWTDGSTIKCANLVGSNVQDLVIGLREPRGIALDIAAGKMYWTHTRKIQRANLDGSNIEDLVIGLLEPRGIALDVAAGKMYWTHTHKIQRANLDGSNIEDLVIGLRAPRGIALSLPPIAREDMNADGVVDAKDLVYISLRHGQAGENRADVNKDGIVNIEDLILVAAVIDGAAAAPAARSRLPKGLTAAVVNWWLTEAKLSGTKSPAYRRGIRALEQLLTLLTSMAPKETTLLPNYPNPFNPETWMPYRLAEDADVKLTIYDQMGQVVRTLDVGHRVAGAYESQSEAVYWDGSNNLGEQVSSGVYFYHLSAGDYSKTRRMVILK